jgi:hypothetical protein
MENRGTVFHDRLNPRPGALLRKMPRKNIRAIKWLILYGAGSLAIESMARRVAAGLYAFAQAYCTSSCTSAAVMRNGV